MSANTMNTGLWTDWEKGSFMGWTLTWGTREAGILSNFLALYTHLATTLLFSLMLFTVHQIKARRVRGRTSGGRHAMMVAIRNITSPFSGTRTFAQVAWAWGSPEALGWAFLCSLFFLVSWVAGVLSSRTLISSDHAMGLMNSSQCGVKLFQIAGDSDAAYENELQALLMQTSRAAAYAGSCYGTSLSSMACPNLYIQSRLGRNATTISSCPFGDLCLTSSLSMQSALISSRDDLGLVTEDANTLWYRRKTTCSVLDLSDNLDLETRNLSSTLSNSYVNVLLGPLTGTNTGIAIANWSFTYDRTANFANVAYGLSSLWYSPGTNNTWQPIDPLRYTNADTSVFFLTSGPIEYPEACHDAWFNATSFDANPGYEVFFASNYVNALACVDQHEICLDAGAVNCTAPSPALRLNETLHAAYNISEVQKGVMDRISGYLSTAMLAFSVYSRGAAALQASTTVSLTGGVWQQKNLPDNQWTVEVRGWFDTQLAMLQQYFVLYAAPPLVEYYDSYVSPPPTSQSKALCNSQKVPLPRGYSSFQFSGIVIILCTGGLLILAGVLVPIVVPYMEKKWWHRRYTWRAWALDGMLQQARMAQQYRGWGGRWEGQVDSVPLTSDRHALLGEYVVNKRKSQGGEEGAIEPYVDGGDTEYRGLTDDSGEELQVVG